MSFKPIYACHIDKNGNLKINKILSFSRLRVNILLVSFNFIKIYFVNINLK